MRKHYTQMTPAEVAYLMKRVRGSRFTISPHAMDRMQGRRVTPEQIQSVLTYAQVIDANDEYKGHLRVMLRGRLGGQSLCVSVNLNTLEVATVYWNRVDNHHRNLDMSIYTGASWAIA